jgi:hypothetical protein
MHEPHAAWVMHLVQNRDCSSTVEEQMKVRNAFTTFLEVFGLLEHTNLWPARILYLDRKIEKENTS